jgi:hypothetical protein
MENLWWLCRRSHTMKHNPKPHTRRA